MSHHFKARRILYDKDKDCFVNGPEIIINMDFVVRYEVAHFENTIKDKDMGTIFDVDTPNDHTLIGRSLKVTSNYLEDFMRNTE